MKIEYKFDMVIRGLCLLLYFILVSCSPVNKALVLPVSQNGVLDLRSLNTTKTEWNLGKKIPLRLEGEWAFYWQKFNKDISSADIPIYAKPGSWTKIQPNDQPLPARGFATYKLKILLPEKRPNLVLKTKYWYTASNIIINDKSHAIGTPATAEEETFPISKIVILPLPDASEIDITIEIANYFHPQAGMVKAPMLGKAKDIRQHFEQQRIFEGMLVACLLAFGLYHIMLNYLRPNKVAFWFGIFCIVFSFKTITSGTDLIHLWIPELNFKTDLYMSYFNFYLLVPVFSHLLYNMFPNEMPRRLRNFLNYGSLAFLLTLFLNIELMIELLKGYQALIVITVIATFVVSLLAVRKQRPSALIFFTGFVVMGLVVMLDLVVSISYSMTTKLSSIGMFAFLIAQALVLAKHSSDLYSNNQSLSEQVNISNKKLNRVKRSRQQVLDSQKKKLLADLHDHLGPHMTDLKVLSETIAQKKAIDPAFADVLEKTINDATTSLRDRISQIEDLSNFENDYLGNLHTILLRRYAKVRRQLGFSYGSDVNKVLMHNKYNKTRKTLYIVIQEIVTNDLKYGSEASKWEISRDTNSILIKLKVQTEYSMQKMKPGYGSENIKVRIKEINCKISWETVHNKFQLIITVPALASAWDKNRKKALKS